MTSRGPEGYADYQKVQNWDGPILLNEELEGLAGERKFARVNVSRYACVAGSILITGSPQIVKLNWWSAQTGGVLIATRSFVMNPAIAGIPQLQIRNQGPWLEVVTSTGKVGEGYSVALTLLGSNRLLIQEFPQRGKVLLANSNPLVEKSGGQKDVFPGSYYTGPMRVKIFSGGASWTVFLQIESEPGSFVVVDVIEGVSNVNKIQNLIAPPGSWKFTLINTSGADENIAIVAYPSVTGST